MSDVWSTRQSDFMILAVKYKSQLTKTSPDIQDIKNTYFFFEEAKK